MCRPSTYVTDGCTPLIVAPYFHLTSDWHAWLDACQIGLTAARESTNLIAQAAMYRALAYAHLDLVQLDRAIDYGHRAVEIYRSASNKPGVVRTLRTLGTAHVHQGDLDQAIALLHEAHELARQVESTYFQDAILVALGNAYMIQDRHDEAVTLFQVVLRHRRADDDSIGTAFALSNLGEAHVRAGRYKAAIPYFDESMQITNLRWPGLAAEALDLLGLALQKTGERERARECWTRALGIMEQLNYPAADEVRDRLANLEKPATTTG